MGSSALRYSGAASRHGRSPLLKLQSDERLVNMVRRGNQGAFEVLVARYNARLLSFCRHMLGSREDAEDVLQDVLTASYNAMLADDRPINVRPWLYRIARNRCLNHLRRNRAVGVDSMDIHFAEHGATTADKVHEREEFRQLLHDIRDLPETQRTALVLREMDALSYEQIAEAMETTVSSVKSLLVRARVSLTEAAEARLLTCEEVREELAEIAEGMRRKQSASVRRHVKACTRCQVFQGEMKKSSRALAALAPVGPLAFLHKLLFAHAATHSAGSAGAGVASAAGAGGAGGAGVAGAAGAAGAGAAGAAGAGAAGAGAAGAGAAAGAAGGAGSAGLVTAGVGAVATKAAAGIAAAALVTAGTVAIDHSNVHRHTGPSASTIVQRSLAAGLQNAVDGSRLGGSVGPGPGLSLAVVSNRLVKTAHHSIAHSVIAVGTSVSQASHATKDTTSGTSKVDKTDSSVQAPPARVVTPPATTQTTAVVTDPTVSTSGGAGLTTSSTATTSTPTTATASDTMTTSTPTDTSTTSATGTTTTPSQTDTTTGTSTSPTTTSPTTTSPTGTTTAPTGTTTSPSTTGTTAVDTSTDAGTTSTPPPATVASGS